MTVGDEPAPQAQRRRKVKTQLEADESIYIKREPAPYIPAIRPLRRDDDDVARDDGGATAESSEMAAERSRRESYQARAKKAWETKRRRQRERFEQLEAPAPHQVSADDSLSTPYRALPDNCPKDDLLRSLHAYASRYYASKGLLQPQTMSAQVRRRQSATPHAHGKSNAAARNDAGSSSDDDYGSVYQDSDANDGTPEARSASLSAQPLNEVMEAPKQAGGQRGKRKVKDMHRALDGPALLALGILVQEQIVARIQAEGYALRPIDRDGPAPSDFELSDDDDDDDEEG